MAGGSGPFDARPSSSRREDLPLSLQGDCSWGVSLLSSEADGKTIDMSYARSPDADPNMDAAAISLFRPLPRVARLSDKELKE